jgi:hypothetical protein
MNYLPEKVEKYLSKYYLPNWELENNSISKIDSIIVIPAIYEYQNIKALLESLSENDNKYFPSTLIIFVINNSPSSDNGIKEDNQKSINLIHSLIAKQENDEFTKKIISSGLRLALVNAASKGKELPDKECGVGLARKIGMDLALTAFDYTTQNKKLIISLDADCVVQNNYLTEIIDNFYTKNFSAATVKFMHSFSGNETADAIICYEIFLRYYTLGLKLAGSPFAFQIVGSTMVFNLDTYLKVEGMNKRKAAEDFYFLEKIAKRSKITEINSTTVYPSSRSSWRVPFGTGRSVQRFNDKVQNEYLLYDPESFLVLKDWLKVLNKHEKFTGKEYLSSAENIHPALYQFLIENKFENSWNKIINNSKSAMQLEKQKADWFDGLRTLKLVHYLRDKAFPLINMFDALDSILSYFNYSPGIKRENGKIPPKEEQVTYLNILRELT